MTLPNLKTDVTQVPACPCLPLLALACPCLPLLAPCLPILDINFRRAVHRGSQPQCSSLVTTMSTAGTPPILTPVDHPHTFHLSPGCRARRYSTLEFLHRHYGIPCTKVRSTCVPPSPTLRLSPLPLPSVPPAPPSAHQNAVHEGTLHLNSSIVTTASLARRYAPHAFLHRHLYRAHDLPYAHSSF